MGVLEIVLLIGGILCIVASFLVGEKDHDEEYIADIQKRELTEQDKEYIRKQVELVINEQISEVSEKTEAELDKISNVKILEMNDYAETIMKEINRNHNETVFLYDMLNEKAKEVKTTVKDVNIAKKEVAKATYAVANATSNVTANAISNVASTNTSDAKSDAFEALKPETVKTVDSESVVYSQADTVADSGSKDLAKQRLIDLVKKSTERSAQMQAEAQAKVRSANIEAKTEIKPKKVAKSKKSGANTVVSGEVVTEDKPAVIETAAEGAETTGTVVEEKSSTSVKEKAATKKASTKKSTTKKTSTRKSVEEKLQAEISRIKNDNSASKNDIIIAMHGLGMSNKDIAKELALGVGEVKLVIDLYVSSK